MDRLLFSLAVKWHKIWGPKIDKEVINSYTKCLISVKIAILTPHIMPGLQKMFSLSGTIKSNGQNFLSNMCTKYTSQAHSVKSLWAGFRPRAFWRSLAQSAPIFEPLCKYYYFYFLVLNIFCWVNFFSGTGGPWSCGFCRPVSYHRHWDFLVDI